MNFDSTIRLNIIRKYIISGDFINTLLYCSIILKDNKYKDIHNECKIYISKIINACKITKNNLLLSMLLRALNEKEYNLEIKILERKLNLLDSDEFNEEIDRTIHLLDKNNKDAIISKFIDMLKNMKENP